MEAAVFHLTAGVFVECVCGNYDVCRLVVRVVLSGFLRNSNRMLLQFEPGSNLYIADLGLVELLLEMSL
jgi:hypothetical protein